jgi:hypothetical protein
VLQGGDLPRVEADRCPNCGYVLRLRPGIDPAGEKIVIDWLREQAIGQT